MIAIGVILFVAGVAGLVFLFGVKNSATMAALGRGKGDE
jgi:flagellar basal body-associated protein FliL